MRGSSLSLLEDALAAELRVTQSIASLTELEREALRGNDMSRLAEVVQWKEAKLAELTRLEAERDEAARRWSREASPDAGADLSFDQMLRHVDRSTARELDTLRRGIEAHMEHARSLGAGNRALVQAALDRNAALRDYLVTTAAGDQVYGPGGGRRVANFNALLDWNG